MPAVTATSREAASPRRIIDLSDTLPTGIREMLATASTYPTPRCSSAAQRGVSTVDLVTGVSARL